MTIIGRNIISTIQDFWDEDRILRRGGQCWAGHCVLPMNKSKPAPNKSKIKYYKEDPLILAHNPSYVEITFSHSPKHNGMVLLVRSCSNEMWDSLTTKK